MAVVLNILIRLSLVYFLGEVMLFPDDPRFAGKAIPIRNLVIVSTLSMLIPLLYWLGHKWKKYPFKKLENYPWITDNIFLSIFWLDMAGNSFNLYDTYYYFNLIPHFHGAGAAAVFFRGIFGTPYLSAAGLATIVHVLLEAQEYYTDVFAGTHNVGDVSDTINDLLSGILGVTVYMLMFFWLTRKKRAGN